MASARAILLISCSDQMGIVARISNLLFGEQCNILTSDQYSDDEDDHFFWRIYFESLKQPLAEIQRKLGERIPSLFPDLKLDWRLYDIARRDRMVIMASKLPHCMMDLLSRYHFGELAAEVVAVISNHPDLGPLAKPFGVPFVVIPVVREGKKEAEGKLLATLREMRADTVVLARYMQVLSADLLRAWGLRIINIHHSFLPAFAGAQPHKQARERGVKMIGATAHYVTEELDGGPIIAQAATAVTHRDAVADLARKGRDLEVAVLAQAVRAHLQKRVLTHRNRTVVFD